MATVTFVDEAKTVDVAEGGSLLDAALAHQIDLPHTCDGLGECGACHVVVTQGLSGLPPLTAAEAEQLEFVAGRTRRSRLACCCRVRGAQHVTVQIPAYASVEERELRQFLAS